MKPKKVKFQNYKSGRIIEADSITDFCKQAGLKIIDKYHFTAILNKERFHHKGWHIPDNNQYIIKDIYGNEYLVNNILLFCKTYSLNVGKINKLVNFKISSYNGLYMAGTEPPIFKPRKVYKYTFTDGKNQITDTNISNIAGKIGVSKTTLYDLSRGSRSKLKNDWKLTNIQEKNYRGKILNIK